MKLSRKAIKEGLGQMPIDTLLLGIAGDKEKRLTPKQREFARQIALGESKASAYRKSYNSKGKPETQSRKGQELMKRDAIQAQTEAFRAAIEAQRLATPAHIRALTIHELTKHALNEDFPPAQRVKALELLGKITEVSLFTERREIVHTKPAEEIREKLLESIRAAIKNGAEDAEVKDADSLLSEIRESNLSSDKVTDAPGDSEPGESHFVSDNVTTWRESDRPEDVLAGADMADEAGAGACDSAGGATPPEGHPPMGV